MANKIYDECKWNGFKQLNFEFEGKNAIIVCPEKPLLEKKWLFKTEYFGAFPKFEIEMLHLGYYVAHVENTTRWCLPEDTERQARFSKYLNKNFGLNSKCVPVGMSCGGMQAIYLAAKHPEVVAAMYIDAPVLNLLSCPCGIGLSNNNSYQEFIDATGMTVSQLINYREHPIDYVDKLIENKIPVMLVCGDSDTVVPFCENGEILLKKYRQADVAIEVVVKAGCNHHPHGLEDDSSIIEFVEKYY